ncbi:MAG: ABC transporter permease subunit [Treponema sp.]|nr:ABC transporter permease subunit [Treponema sp.]
MSNKKQKNPAIIIMKRELKSYFSGPIAYIVTALFLIISGFMFFSTFFLQNRAELRNYFALLPILLSFFIPALTMRVFSEEKRVGSIETLMTLPITETNVVAGKYLAVFIETLVMLAPTLFFVLAAEIFGTPDYGPIVGGYLGAVFLCACFAAIGLFASSITKNQIISFFVGFIICIVLTMIDTFLILFPAPVVSALSFLSANVHFSSIEKGIIDSRDLLYFISLAALFFVLTVKVQQSAKN